MTGALSWHYNCAMHPTHTVADCHLNGAPIAINNWTNMTRDQLAQVVGNQQPGEQDGETPEGGWSAAYERHLESDRQAVADGSPEYAGRDEWIRHVWLPETRIYPLYLVHEPDGGASNKPRLRLLDGHRRLAGAFYYPFNDRVFAVVGSPLMAPPTA